MHSAQLFRFSLAVYGAGRSMNQAVPASLEGEEEGEGQCAGGHRDILSRTGYKDPGDGAVPKQYYGHPYSPDHDRSR